jgi:hypothetical protein
MKKTNVRERLFWPLAPLLREFIEIAVFNKMAAFVAVPFTALLNLNGPMLNQHYLPN